MQHRMNARQGNLTPRRHPVLFAVKAPSARTGTSGHEPASTAMATSSPKPLSASSWPETEPATAAAMSARPRPVSRCGPATDRKLGLALPPSNAAGRARAAGEGGGRLIAPGTRVDPRPGLDGHRDRGTERQDTRHKAPHVSPRPASGPPSAEAGQTLEVDAGDAADLNERHQHGRAGTDDQTPSRATVLGTERAAPSRARRCRPQWSPVIETSIAADQQATEVTLRQAGTRSARRSAW